MMTWASSEDGNNFDIWADTQTAELFLYHLDHFLFSRISTNFHPHCSWDLLAEDFVTSNIPHNTSLFGYINWFHVLVYLYPYSAHIGFMDRS